MNYNPSKVMQLPKILHGVRKMANTGKEVFENILKTILESSEAFQVHHFSSKYLEKRILVYAQLTLATHSISVIFSTVKFEGLKKQWSKVGPS